MRHVLGLSLGGTQICNNLQSFSVGVSHVMLRLLVLGTVTCGSLHRGRRRRRRRRVVFPSEIGVAISEHKAA